MIYVVGVVVVAVAVVLHPYLIYKLKVFFGNKNKDYVN